MFTQPNGKPIDPRSDHNEWKALLAEAEVRDARLHDARDTAATVLLLLGVQLPTVMEIMGWSNTKVAKRYSHVTPAIQTNIAPKVNKLLWGYQREIETLLGLARGTPGEARAKRHEQGTRCSISDATGESHNRRAMAGPTWHLVVGNTGDRRPSRRVDSHGCMDRAVAGRRDHCK